ncbi:MAG TPA: M14 family zinc carboxypeptidase [Phycisphaerae bacterium]|nr:M14 family zinc carboxypeptidase [Phycisphaerae bacterium]
MKNVQMCLVGLAVCSFVFTNSSATAADPVKRYDDLKVLRVQVNSPLDVSFIQDIGADIWSHHPFGEVIDVCVDASQLAALERSGLQYETWIDNVQQLVDAERAGVRGTDYFDDYHNYADIQAYLEQLVAAHPTLASMFDVGTSLEGRTIRGIRVAGPNVDEFSPAVIYFSAVHAREWIATTIPPYLANHLLSNYGTDSQVTNLVDNVEWFLIPVGNPDGFEYTWNTYRLWRKNRRDNGDGSYGVDINRNWGWGWGGEGASDFSGDEDYHGPSPFSEPETQALRDLFLAHPNVRAQLDIHSYSQLILWPWGYQSQLPADQASYNTIGQTMRSLIQSVHGRTYDIGPIYTAIYPASGGSLDWTYGERKVLSYSFELRDTGSFGFLLPASQIVANNEEILPAIMHMTGTDEVLATQINLFGEVPDGMLAGQTTSIPLAITSGVEDLSPASAELHYRYDASGPFKTVPMQQVDGAEFLAELPATNCSSTPEFYFAIATSNGVVTEPAGAPGNVYAATVQQQPTIIFEENMDTDPGWTTTGQWAWGKPMGLAGDHGGPDPTSGYTGNNVYGYNLSGGYTNGMSKQTLTTGAIDCTGESDVHLSFWRWLGVEQPAYDDATIEVSNNGSSWTTIWSNAQTISDTSWQFQSFDISAVADGQASVQIRWTLGPTDSSWTFCGWNIDDVQVTAATCIGMYGDFNGDSQVDVTDHAAFAPCMQGPDGGLLPECGIFDSEQDGDVDLIDAMQMQQAITLP